MSLLLALIVGLGLIGGVSAAIAVANYWLILAGFAPMLALALLVAPYKLWKEKADRVIALTTKRLKLQIEEQPEVTPIHIWYHLIVRNLSTVPIEGCYGQLLSFTPNKNNRPYNTINLPWSTLTGEYTRTMTIPGKTPRLLDVVMTNRKELYVCAPYPDPLRVGTPFSEPPGRYEAEIQVGSEEEEFEPSTIKLIMTLDKNGNLHVEEQQKS